jgi:hypothetical protein
MMIFDKRIKDLLPAHYSQYYPRLIKFLEKYYDWLYRTSGLSELEVQDLKNDTSWLVQDLDKFIATGKLRYMDQVTDPNVLDTAIIDINGTEAAGVQAAMLPDNYNLEDNFNGFVTADDMVFNDVNNNDMELTTVEDNILDGWFNSMGFDRIQRNRLYATTNAVDQVLMLSLLKHIYAIKGTETSIKLFFDLYFNEQVTIFYPKPLIGVIDDNMIIDGIQVIRDDELYQEYSYVINVANDPASYQDIFDTIYKKLIHPSGFRVELRQTT